MGLGLGLTQHRLGLAFELQQSLHLLFCAGLLGPKFEQCSGAKHLGGTAGVLFTGKLQHQLVFPHTLEGGFSHTETVHAPFEHLLNCFQLFFCHLLDCPSWQHLQGELAATPEIKAELEWKTE